MDDELRGKLEKPNNDLKKISLAQDLLKQVIKKLGTGEIKNNVESFKEYRRLRAENGIPLTFKEQARLSHIAEQADMAERGE